MELTSYTSYTNSMLFTKTGRYSYAFGSPIKDFTYADTTRNGINGFVKNAKDKYRYGFNGKELDAEGGDPGNTYDYGFRIYNPALGRFLSVDPLARSYPWNSTYAFAENDVIRSIDLDGLEKYIITQEPDYMGKHQFTITLSTESIKEQTAEGVPQASFDGGKTYSSDFRYQELQCFYGNTEFDEQNNLRHKTREENYFGVADKNDIEKDNKPRLHPNPQAKSTIKSSGTDAPEFLDRKAAITPNHYTIRTNTEEIFSTSLIATGTAASLLAAPVIYNVVLSSTSEYQFNVDAGLEGDGVAGGGNLVIMTVNGVEVVNQVYNGTMQSLRFNGSAGDNVQITINRSTVGELKDDGYIVDLLKVSQEQVVDVECD